MGNNATQVYSSLYQPGRIGSMPLRNRFVQSPIFTQYAGPFGDVTQRMIDYYRARARGGVGLIITENTSVDWIIGRSVGHPIRIDHDRFIAGLTDLTEAVHNEGAKIAVQLHHTGRQNSRGNTEHNEPPLAPTAGITSAFGTPPRAVELEEIPGLIDLYVEGAKRAVNAGFDAVELHGAHGYLLGQFLSPKTNKREDEYGGSLENRARFALEVVRAVRDTVGPDFPILYRLSLEEPYEGGLSMDDGLAFCEMLESHVDALDISAGNYGTADTLLPMKPPGSLVPYAKAVKDCVSIPVIGVGRLVWMFEEMNKAVEQNELDFVALGRSQLADPETVTKTRRGEEHRVRRCIGVNECISRWMFNSKHTQCVINPALSQEARAEQALSRADVPRQVLIIGAGPAGCEAAIVAAERGHDVTVVEREPEIGGQLRAWAAASFLKTEIKHMINFYQTEMNRLGVIVRCGEEVEEREAANYDSVLLATGTESSGAPDHAYDAIHMLITERAPEENEVTVYGNTEVAMFAALWLVEQGKKVILSSPSEEVGVDTNDMQRDHLLGLLEAANIEIRKQQSAPGNKGVVWAQDRTASKVLKDAVDEDTAWEIGSRARGGRLYEATQSGFWTASRI